jgi:hypothetical protein
MIQNKFNKKGVNKSTEILLYIIAAFLIAGIAFGIFTRFWEGSTDEINITKEFEDIENEHAPERINLAIEELDSIKFNINSVDFIINIKNKGNTLAEDVTIDVRRLYDDDTLGETVYYSDTFSIEGHSEKPLSFVMELRTFSQNFVVAIDHDKDEDKKDNVRELRVDALGVCKTNDDCTSVFGGNYYCHNVDKKCTYNPFSKCDNLKCPEGYFCSAENDSDGYCMSLKEDGWPCDWTANKNHDSCENDCYDTISKQKICLSTNFRFVSDTDCCYGGNSANCASDVRDNSVEVCSEYLKGSSFENYVAVGADADGCMSDCVLYCKLNDFFSIDYTSYKRKDKIDEYLDFNGAVIETDTTGDLIDWIKLAELKDVLIDRNNCVSGDKFYGDSDIRKSNHVLVGLDVKDGDGNTCPKFSTDATSIDWVKTCNLNF